jgi:hypothetical protein
VNNELKKKLIEESKKIMIKNSPLDNKFIEDSSVILDYFQNDAEEIVNNILSQVGEKWAKPKCDKEIGSPLWKNKYRELNDISVGDKLTIRDDRDEKAAVQYFGTKEFTVKEVDENSFSLEDLLGGWWWYKSPACPYGGEATIIDYAKKPKCVHCGSENIEDDHVWCADCACPFHGELKDLTK